MRLVFDTPSWFYSKKNSDWQMKLKLAAGLNAFSPEIQKACSDGLLIPMSGRAESLNAGVAASIFAWEMSR